MGNIHTFQPRSSTRAPRSLPAPTPTQMRQEIEDAAQAALDTVERLIALLDRMDGQPDDEDGADAEPSLGAPEGHASQIVWLRGTAQDLEIAQQPERRS